MNAKDRILFALDVSTLQEAIELVQQLSGHVGGFKVGLELLTAQGSQSVVNAIHEHQGQVFYDGKFKDIPATVAGAAKAAANLGVLMFNVHASGGVEMMRAAIANKGRSLVLAVTVLTSINDEACWRSYRNDVATTVTNLALMAEEAGVDGLICSPQELSILKSNKSLRGLKYIIPGVRPTWAAADDQKRIMTPGEAVKAGADYVVIGRPIRKPPKEIGSPVEAAKRIAAEIEEALS